MNIFTIAKKYREQIWQKVEKSKRCWEWTGHKTTKGYGRYGVYPNKAEYAHRLLWVMCGNLLPKGFVLDHLCKNRGCVNPDHLQLVTIKQNTLENSNSLPAQNKQKQLCIKGHKLSGKNLAVYKGERRCKQCDKARERKRIIIRNGKLYPMSARAEGKSAESFFETLTENK